MRIDRPVASVRDWPGLRSEYYWLPPDGTVTVTRPYQIGVSFSAHERLVHETDAGARYLAVSGGAVFANGSHDVRWAEVTEPTEALELYPDLDLLRDAVDVPHADGLEIEPAVAAHDATVLGLAASIRWAHVNEPWEPDAMWTSTLVYRLIEHLADHYCRPRARRIRRTGGLSRVAVDRLSTYVDDRLVERLALDDLAAQVQLSVYHFARAFKATTGMPPHEFVTMRRMERAKTLLLGTRESVADIAYAVGYSNVGHFRRLLRRYTGFAPSDLRSP